MMAQSVWQPLPSAGDRAYRADRADRLERALALLEKVMVYGGVSWDTADAYASLYSEVVRLDPKFPIGRWMAAARIRRQERILGGLG